LRYKHVLFAPRTDIRTSTLRSIFGISQYLGVHPMLYDRSREADFLMKTTKIMFK